MGDRADALAAFSREAAFETTADGRIRWADARAAARLGLSEGGALLSAAAPGTEEKLRAFLTRATREPVERWEVALIAAGQTLTVHLAGQPHEGGVRVLASLVPQEFEATLRQVNEAMEEIVALHREVSRQRRALAERNEALTRLNRELSDSHQGVLALLRELEDRNEAMSRTAEARKRVVQHVSHEFRTPVSAIQTLARLLEDELDGPLQPEQRRQVGFIRASALSLGELLDDVLDLSRLEAGKTAVHAERFSVAELMSSLRGILRPLVPADRPVEIVFEEVPPTLVADTDRPKLGQILRNLVANALKFTERGEVRVQVRAAGRALVFFVRDTGIGIAPEDQARIFEEFSQVPASRRPAVKGTGLGLPLSRALAERLGGTLTVESALGAGATFTLRIPAVHPEVVALRALEERARSDVGARARVLVVEDDLEAMLSYEERLLAGGYLLVPARNLGEAQEVLARERPAAIVLDVLLQGSTSWEFLRALKQDPATREVPVIVVTITHKEAMARELGADAYLLKPLDPAELVRRVTELVRAPGA